MPGHSKTSVQHVEGSSEHEAVLAGVMALANLFSNCVEAFNLIHPTHRWDKTEQLLLCRLGVQQARLLVWGDVVGISSPPSTVTDRAVPKHPSSAYPDLTEPTFFQARDARLDDTEIRHSIEAALSDIVDRSASATREEMMDKYGLKPPKRLAADIFQPALDTNRLEAFRERYELLQEVAESYAHLSTRRNASIVQTSWNIANEDKFVEFIALTQERIDTLIALMDVTDRVDRAMCMDIRVLGWHLSNDRGRITNDRTILRLVHQACRDSYPQYLPAVQTALNNIERELKESTIKYENPYAGGASLAEPPRPPPKIPTITSAKPVNATNDGGAKGSHEHKDHHGLFGGLFKSFGKKNGRDSRSASVSSVGSAPDVAPRSNSDAGPARGSGLDPSSLAPPEDGPVRSKSVGTIIPPAPAHQAADDDADEARDGIAELHFASHDDADDEGIAPDEIPPGEFQTHLLGRVGTNDTVELPLEGTSPVTSMISRHDQYHGLGRQGTKNQ